MGERRVMRSAARWVVGLAAMLGCVELRYPNAPSDRPVVVDALDASDLPVATDTTAMDVRDAAVLRDVMDVPDAADAMDAPDVPDVPDVRDVPDVPDVRDVPDVPDVRDVPDVPDVRDVPVDVVPEFNPTVVTLQSDTATFSQTPSYEVTWATDSNRGGGQGWAIAPAAPGPVGEESAAWEFATTTPFSAVGTRVEVAMVSNVANYRLVCFRFRLTTASRELFADGIVSRGNVGAAPVWTTPLTVASVAATNGVLIAVDAGVVRASTEVTTSTYTVILDTPASQLTGIRLDTLYLTPAPTGPGNGTGTNPGNFILGDIRVTVSRHP